MVANPLPEDEQLDPELHDRALRAGLEEMRRRNVRGKDVTPFLLDRFAAETEAESLRVNRRIILKNASLAARIAVALSALDGPGKVNTPRVVVVGDLIYDLLARTEGPVAFGTDTFAPIQAVAGGSGANAAAWLASLGMETHFVGRVGDDVFGEALVAELERSGVTAHLAQGPLARYRQGLRARGRGGGADHDHRPRRRRGSLSGGPAPHPLRRRAPAPLGLHVLRR